jgi:hypothetical protein
MGGTFGQDTSNLEGMERWFWEHVEFQMLRTGETEQQVLDAIKTPGFTGRRARLRNQQQPEQSGRLRG